MALTEQVIMPGADYQEIADQTRTLDGTSETLKSGEVAAKLQAATTTVAAQTAQINALIELANSLPEAGSGGGGGGSDEWELVQTVSVSSDVTEYVLGDLSTYCKLRFVANKQVWGTKSGSNWIGVYGDDGTTIKRSLLPGALTYLSQLYDVEWIGGFITFSGYTANNLQTTQSLSKLTHYAGSISETPRARISLSAETAASAVDGATFDVYGVKRTSSSGRSLGITSATVGQIAKISAVDAAGRPTAWEAVDLPSGGSPKEWTKIIDLDFSEEGATNIISITDLPNVTEFYFLGSSLATDESSDSGFSLFINSNLLVESGQLIRIGKSSRGVNQYATVKFNGLFWDILSSTQATAVTSKTMGTARLNSYCVPDVGPAESLKLQIPTYLPITGKLEVWAR